MKKLSNAEKLTVLVAASCRPDLKDYFVDVKKVAEWVAHGDEWALSWEYDYFDTEPHPLDPIVAETREIFDMFLHLQRSMPAELSQAGLLLSDVEFGGFDGNNDKHFHVAKIIVDDLDAFQHLKNASANSHSIVSLPTYRKKLAKYKAEMLKRLDADRSKPLVASELKEVFSK